MSVSPVSHNSPVQRAAEQREDAKARDEKAAFDAAQPVQGVPRESFIASVVAARHPPRLPLETGLTSGSTGDASLFRVEMDSLAKRSETALAADMAEIYLAFSDDARIAGDPDLIEAFEYLGETMVNYEHLRLLRNGQLG